MCLAVPAKVLSVEGDQAQVDFGGASRAVNGALGKGEPGQYVSVHAGFAISVMDEAEANLSLETWREFLEFQDQLDAEEGA